ncbi:hypothetical protein CNMCM7927_002823 [Aspergillus lentulus]|nr:hypothetical protein CNMCM7927_002823 [Aspergillus lentulus]
MHASCPAELHSDQTNSVEDLPGFVAMLGEMQLLPAVKPGEGGLEHQRRSDFTYNKTSPPEIRLRFKWHISEPILYFSCLIFHPVNAPKSIRNHKVIFFPSPIMADANRELFDDLLASLKSLPEISYEALARRVHYKARHVSQFSSMMKYIADVDPYPSDDKSTNASLAGGEDCTARMERMGSYFLSHGVRSVDQNKWTIEWYEMAFTCLAYEMYMFWNDGIIRPLMPLLLGEHIENRIEVMGKKSLYTLPDAPGFTEFFLNEVQTKDFASNVMDTDAATGDHLFSISILLIADYLHYGTFQPRLTQIFDKERPAYQILAKWSQYSWEVEPDDESLKKTMLFCGQSATALLTGLEQPQLASLAVKGFYELVVNTSDNEAYTAAIKDALERMDIVVNSMLLPGTDIGLLQGPSTSVEEFSSLNEQPLTVMDHYQLRGSNAEGVQVRVVGFNGERPFATTSQVFRTTTGLRAVDPEIARACSPFAKIEPLKVGHVLYRKKGSSDETVEIKSMQVEPLSEGKLYGVSLPGTPESFYANGYLMAVNNPVQSIRSTTEALRSLSAEQRLACLASLKELNPMFGKHELQAIHSRLTLELFGDHQVGKQRPISSSAVLPKISSPSHLIQIMRDTPRARSNGAPLDRLERTFTLTPAGGEEIQSGYQLPELSVVDGYVLADGEPQLKCTINSGRRTFQWTRQLHSNSFEHGVLEVHPHGLSGRGVILLSSSSEPTEVSGQQIYHFQAMKKNAEVEIDDESHPTARSAGSGQFVVTHHVNMTYDKSVWPADKESNQPDSPIPGMEVRTGIYKSPSGAQMPFSKIRALDDLRTAIKDKFNRDLGQLYDCYHTILESGQMRVKFQFKLASLIPFISDVGEDITTVFNVGFQSTLGTDLTLPILCQSFYIDFDVEEKTVTGALYEYNPLVRDLKGDRHYISGVVRVDESFDLLRSKVSRACAEISDPAMPVARSNKFQAAKITETLHLEQRTDINTLLEPTGYDEVVVHNISQALITSAMYYHMDDKQREDLTDQAKPTDLPSSLAGDLPADVKQFLREKYAPAFLCQMIKRDKKYGTYFSDKQKARLWYWWNGNGKTCLAKSKEYAQLTRISSGEAVKQYLGDELDGFMKDNPESWAETLYTELKSDRRMYWQSCVLDALDQSHNYADDWFKDAVGFIGANQLQYPCISNDTDRARQQLHDVLYNLILYVLTDNASIDQEVREDLKQDIEDFEDANDLDKSEDEASRAMKIIQQISEFITSAGEWITAIEKGLAAAFGGSKLFQISEAVFAKVADAIGDRIPGLLKIKGVASLAMVSIYALELFASLYGIISDWNEMPDGERAKAILEVVRVSVNAAAFAKGAWKQFRGRKGSYSPGDVIDTAELDQGFYKSIAEEGEGLESLCEAINPDASFQEVIGEHLTPEGAATSPGESETWGELPDRPPAGLPAEGEEIASKWKIGGNAIKIFNVCMGILLVAAATYSLVADWDKLSDRDKILNIISTLIQVLQVTMDIVELGEAMGVFAVTGAFATAIPVLGAVLVILGIVMMLVNFFLSLFGSSQPDPVADFVDDVGKKLLDQFEESPPPKLEYTISTDSVTVGQTTSIFVQGQNKSDQELTVSNVHITLTSGGEDDCLFNSDSFELVKDDDSAKDSSKHVYVTPGSTVGAELSNSQLGYDYSKNYSEYDLQVAGCKKETESSLLSLVLQPGESFKAWWTAEINKKGDSFVDVVEKSLFDRGHKQFPIVRA